MTHPPTQSLMKGQTVW